MADLHDEIPRWLRKHDRKFVVALGEESGWWTAEDVDAAIDAAASPAARPVPDHRPPITQARPRPPRVPDISPAVAAVTLKAPDGQRGTLIGPADRLAEVVRPEAVVDQHGTFGTNRGVVFEEKLTPVYGEHVGWDDDETPDPGQVAGVTVDVGEVIPDADVVHPAPPADQQLVDQVDDVEPAPAEVVHLVTGGDVLAAGLAHPDPAVADAARKAAAAIDQLVTALQRTRTTRSRA